MRLNDATTFFSAADFAAACVFGADAFVGILDTADELAFNAATATTHTLRYALGPVLAHGATGTVAGVSFKVAGTPEQVSATDMRANLVKA